MGLKGFTAGGMLRALQPSFRSPSSCTVFLPYKKTLPVFMAFHTRAMSSALRKDCCNFTFGAVQNASLGLDGAQIRKDSLSWYLSELQISCKPASLGGSNTPESSLKLIPQPKMSYRSDPYLDRRAAQTRRGKCWWHFLKSCVNLQENCQCGTFPEYTVWPEIDGWGFGARKISTGLGAC